MKKTILTWCIAALSCLTAHSIEITRYVAEGGTGDGLTKENPSGDLYAILNLSKQVESLNVYLAPGNYKLPAYKDANNRVKYGYVNIFGGGLNEVAPAEQKSVITGDLQLNGGYISNVDFRGSRIGNDVEGYLEGAISGANIYYSNATRIDLTVTDAYTTYLVYVNAKTASISRWPSSLRRPKVVISECTFSDGDGLGVGSSDLTIEDCKFMNCKSTALSIGGCEGASVKRCKFVNNTVAGAVSVNVLTDDIAVIFDKCSFYKNASSTPEFSSVITTRAPIVMQNCLIAQNFDGLDNSKRYMHNQHKGAIELTRRQSQFYNCTFLKNDQPVIYYNMEPADHARITSQFANCVFLNNKSPYYSEKENRPLMRYCAADFGSDIPELDAERNMIRTDYDAAKIQYDGEDYIYIGEGSPLINVGLPVLCNDLYGINHYMFGGTDLGCAEYCGDFKKSDNVAPIAIGDNKYIKYSYTYNGKTYSTLAVEKYIDENGRINLPTSIYLGDNLAPVKVLDENNVIAYMTFNGKKCAVLYKRI